jgi:hypothetical protein
MGKGLEGVLVPGKGAVCDSKEGMGPQGAEQRFFGVFEPKTAGYGEGLRIWPLYLGETGNLELWKIPTRQNGK